MLRVMGGSRQVTNDVGEGAWRKPQTQLTNPDLHQPATSLLSTQPPHLPGGQSCWMLYPRMCSHLTF